jgi:transcriptional regulator with XRE-family HTH domain
MNASIEQRRLLGAFIRSHRERMPAGQARSGRRRTSGLRREEVALLCGISVTWYTWIEQGRDISISAESLARLADTLRLTAAERSYVFELARKRDPAPPAPVMTSMAAAAEPMMAACRAVNGPAYVLDRLWCAVAWNASAGELFGGWLGGSEKCLLRYVFLDRSARSFIVDWTDRAQRLVAEFRADTALAPEEPALRALLAGLRAASPDFARFWQDQEVLGREGGIRLFAHPRDGTRCYQQVTLVPTGYPGHKFVMLIRAPDNVGTRGTPDA